MFTCQTRVNCTAGCTYLLLYPNGDAYRCMADYNARNPPIFNALHDGWIPRTDSDVCLHSKCYAGCDIDWAGKYIQKYDGIKHVLLPKIHSFDAELGSPWQNQDIHSPGDDFVSIVWAPSLLCNYNCHYCGCAASATQIFNQFASAAPMCSPAEWMDIWDNILKHHAYGTVQITGGEPMLSPALLPVLKRIASRFSVCLTSNLSVHLDDLLTSNIPLGSLRETPLGLLPVGLWRITASMHPTASNFDKERFFNSIVKLRAKGYRVDIHFVAHPLQIYQAEEVMQWSEKHGVSFVLSPWTGKDHDGNLASYTLEEKNYISKFINFKKTRAIEEIFYSIAHDISVINCSSKLTIYTAQHDISGVIVNTSDCTWTIDKNIKLGARLYAQHENNAIREFRAPLQEGLLLPGEQCPFHLHCDLVGIPNNTYRLKLDVVNEGNFWLEDKGAIPLEISVIMQTQTI